MIAGRGLQKEKPAVGIPYSFYPISITADFQFVEKFFQKVFAIKVTFSSDKTGVETGVRETI